MGFRTGAWCKIWEVQPVSNTLTKLRISISRKKRGTDEYVQDFGGYVAYMGTAAADKASRLSVGDTIKLGDVDVSNTYNKEKKATYTDFKVFSFEVGDGSGDNTDRKAPGEVGGGETEAPEDDSKGKLPF